MSAEVSTAVFASRLLEAPVGVALLAKLEGAHRRDGVWLGGPKGAHPETVLSAVEAVAGLSVGSLIAVALEAALDIAGPWMPNAPEELAEAYRCAEARAPIAEAVAARFGPALHEAVDRAAQEWWNAPWPAGALERSAYFRDFGNVYGCGEFTWAGLWTVTDPPSETHDLLIGAWEMDDLTVSRWRLPVRDDDGPVFEIHQPADWVRLVDTYPQPARLAHNGWELPGPNQDPTCLAGLVRGGHRHAARISAGDHVVPDWQAIAADYAGVHLSWAGFLTTEGYISDLGHDAVTMLRYWSSERTLWLADVFGAPRPLPAPALTGYNCGVLGADAQTDQARQQSDRAELTVLLGRA